MENGNTSDNEKASLEEIRQDYTEKHLIYAPNSMYHGMKINGQLPISDIALARIEISRLTDFIEFLFEHSVHCDHITQSNAWREFEEFEFKNIKPKL